MLLLGLAPAENPPEGFFLNISCHSFLNVCVCVSVCVFVHLAETLNVFGLSRHGGASQRGVPGASRGLLPDPDSNSVERQERLRCCKNFPVRALTMF